MAQQGERNVVDLRAKAAGQGVAWRKVHSLEAYLDHIMGRLDLGVI
jgi:hypothetical protein